jgi:hypothetical protein
MDEAGLTTWASDHRQEFVIAFNSILKNKNVDILFNLKGVKLE